MAVELVALVICLAGVICALAAAVVSIDRRHYGEWMTGQMERLRAGDRWAPLDK